MTVSFDELLSYWLEELPPEREEEIEEIVFADEEVARRLDVVASLSAGVHRLVRAGRVLAGMTVGAVETLGREGMTIRSYEIDPGQVVPCSIAMEDIVAVRLKVGDAGNRRVDVHIAGELEGTGPFQQAFDDVFVDRDAGEIVLVFPGDQIRALPRSRFTYTVRTGGETLGEYGMDHTPPS